MLKKFGWWLQSIPRTPEKKICSYCGKKYFFYKKDIGTLKEKYCSSCLRNGEVYNEKAMG